MTDRGWRKAILAVAGAAALLCLPFLGAYPLFDPDEGYYPAAAAESLAHGHPLDLTLNGEPRWEKPPLAYALMQVSFLLLGKSEFAARLPSVLEGAALVAILGMLVARVAGGRAGLLSAVVLASSLGHQVMSRAAHPEMALVLGTATAQLLFALWFVAPAGARPSWMWWTAGIAMGFGFLAKGPVVLAMPALMLLAGMLVVPREHRPSWGEVGRVFGLAALLCLALAAPWFLWMGAKHGAPFWRAALGQVGHFASEEGAHFWNVPYYFVPVLLGGFLPWSIFLPRALRGLRRTDPSPAARFRLLIALAAGASFLFWSVSVTKLPNYGLVFFPPLAALVALPYRPDHPGSIAHPAVGVGLGISSAALVCAGLLGGADPFLMGMPPARTMAERILAEAGPDTTVAIYRRRLPSLTFYTGKEVAWPHDPAALAEFLRRPGTRFLVLQQRHLPLLSEEDPARRTLCGEKLSAFVLMRWDGPAAPLRSPPPPGPAAAPPGAGPR